MVALSFLGFSEGDYNGLQWITRTTNGLAADVPRQCPTNIFRSETPATRQ